MRIPDFPRRALARFGHLAVRPVPLLLTLAVVELATVAWLAFDTPHNGWVWHSGGDATEYWTAQWSVAHGFVPQAVISYGLPVFYGWVPLVTGTTLLHGLPVIVPLQALILVPLVLVLVWAVADRALRPCLRGGRGGDLGLRAAPDDARGRRPLPTVVRAVLSRAALGGSHQHGRPAVGRRGARDDVGGAARGRLRTRRPSAPRGRVRGGRDRDQAGQRVLRPRARRPLRRRRCGPGSRSPARPASRRRC